MNAVTDNLRHARPGGISGLKKKALGHQYVLAVLLAIVAFGIRYLLSSILGDELPFMLFIAAALISAWYGGAIAGFMTLALGLLLGESFFHSPKGVIGGYDSIEMFRLLRYLFTSTLGILLIEKLRRGERRARATAEVLRREVERRKASEAELEQAKSLISQHASELERRVEQRTAELSASVKSLEGILYHVAHNFHAPIRAMEGFMTLLEREYGKDWDPKARDYADRVSTSAKRLERLTQDLLSYGRLTHARLRLTAVNPEEAVEQAWSKLFPHGSNQRAQMTLERPLPWVRADKQMFQQVLFQLLENAVKFVSVGTSPQVRIWSEQHGTKIRIWIEDKGVGIDPRFQERIFAPFERQKTVEGYYGNGVGLAIVKESVERMGGCVGVKSQLGEGSRFWVELPSS